MNPNELNNFFENATPAQINQLHASDVIPEPIEQEVQPEPLETASSLTSSEAVPEETPQQLRFRDIREAKMKAEWERDQMAKELEQLRAAPRNAPVQVEEEEDEDYGIGDDELLEGKHLAKIIKSVEKKVERKVTRQFQQQNAATQAQLVDQRLRQEHPDIDHVLSFSSELARLRPSLARSLLANPDTYSQLKATYEAIKDLKLVPESPSADRQRMQQNLAKPRAVQTVAPRPSGLTDISSYDGNLTQEQKNEIYNEMRKYSR